MDKELNIQKCAGRKGLRKELRVSSIHFHLIQTSTHRAENKGE